jgi:hypothetical protein
MPATAKKGAVPRTPAEPLPEKITWQETVIVRGGFAESPIPEFAITIVQASWDKHTAYKATLKSEAQAKAALHQIRRAATSMGLGLAARVNGAELSVLAKQKKVVTKKA